MNEQWINEMRQKMTDYQWPVPEVSWDEIYVAVAANKARQARLLWLRRMAAAALVLLIAGVGYWGLRHKSEPIVEKHWAQERSQGDRNDVTSQTSHAFFDKRSGNAEHQSPCEPKETKLEHHSTAMSEPEVVPISMGDNDTLNTTEPTEKEQPQAVEEKAKPVNEILPVIYPSDLHQQKHIDNRLTAKVYMSSTMAGRQTESFITMSSYSKPTDVHPKEVMVNQDIHHRQPVRFGLSLRYRLNDRWSVESGLTYTRLSSDITTTIENETSTTEQRLNYIGLPLNISYNIWKSRNFGLYISAGCMIEKSLDTSPWQFSLNGAAGAEYKLTDFFSLYAEPGLGYYFKDGSSIPTIYKDHPLNFNLSFGLRFSLK